MNATVIEDPKAAANDVAAKPGPEGPLEQTTPEPATPGPVPAPAVPFVLRAYGVLRREPILFVTLGYLGVSFIGLWANYWFYGSFGIPVLEYMQASDVLVAGLREPAYAGVLAAAAVFTAIFTWPAVWSRRHPERAQVLQGKWWGRLLFRETTWARWSRLALQPEDALLFGVLWASIWLLFGYVINKAEDIRGGGGHVVEVTLAGERQPLPGDARLLGTTSGFVFVWWPQEKRAEAIAMEGVARIRSLPASQPVARPVRQPAVKPANTSRVPQPTAAPR